MTTPKMRAHAKWQKFHYFKFKIRGIDGKSQIVIAKAVVRQPPHPVNLPLAAEHVRKSIKLKGVGNTGSCSMAVCAMANATLFGHPVEGYIDWQYGRAYVVSKVRNGLPVECYVYEHRDDIAKLNDSKGGQQKLLKQLEENGDRIIRLVPRQPSRNAGSNLPATGDPVHRAKPLNLLKGARARFAFAEVGGV